MARTVSWQWGGKTHTGTVTRTTKTHIFAKTKNGKIKKDKEKEIMAPKKKPARKPINAKTKATLQKKSC